MQPLHPRRLSAGSSNIRLPKAAVRWIELFKEAHMLSMRMPTLLAVALLPFLATSLSAQQAAPKMDKTRAARAECFRQANAAVQAQVACLLLIPLLLQKLTLMDQMPITHASAKRAS